MSKKFVQLPEQMQEALATNAGIMLSEFDPENPGTAESIRSKLLFATSGGVSHTCAATTADFGADVDNCPKNTKELLTIESWECSLSGTALTVTDTTIASQLGAADVTNSSKDTSVKVIKPRVTVNLADFKDLWYVCPYGTGDGFVAVRLLNAFSTGGLSFQSSDKAKGTWSFTYTGFASIDDTSKVPVEYYVKPSANAAAAQVNVD